MKVLQILPELNSGGVERGTLEVAGRLVAEGHEALVVSNGGRLVAELERSGARHFARPVHRKRLTTLLQIAPLRRLLTAERPDILHLRSRAPAWVAWLAWRKMNPATRPRLVSTVHGFYSVNAYSAVMTRGERVIAVSESVRAYVLANYRRVDPARLTTIHRGVDPAAYPAGWRAPEAWRARWEQEFPATKGKSLLTLPGRLTRWKGAEDFIAILAELRRRGLPVHGALVGETHPKKRAYEGELRAAIASAGLTDHVTLTGVRSDLREIMAESAAVLSLSLDPEAFGRTTLEALCLGRPVAGYAHGGVGEQLTTLFPEGVVPAGDRAAMADKLAEWLRPGGGPRCAPGLNRDFTLNRMLERTLDVYCELAASPR
ncbi:glycosyltransferase [bacterium]|jgi:glycosyltransferase involved in cell wall biosynthesis|nr:glycosyltransferase [bacterium]